MGATALLLKQHTAATHARVEAGLDLLGPALTPSRLRSVLDRFHGFWAATEPALAAWAAAEPRLAAELRLARRTRAALLRADVAALDTALGRPRGARSALAPAVFAPVDTAAALGWLYVVEGSTLGGAVIDRRLRALGDGLPPLTSFTPYAEGPGPMWRGYLDVLERWTAAEPARPGAVAAAAGTAFAALADWVAPLCREAAA